MTEKKKKRQKPPLILPLSEYHYIHASIYNDPDLPPLHFLMYIASTNLI